MILESDTQERLRKGQSDRPTEHRCQHPTGLFTETRGRILTIPDLENCTRKGNNLLRYAHWMLFLGK